MWIAAARKRTDVVPGTLAFFQSELRHLTLATEDATRALHRSLASGVDQLNAFLHKLQEDASLNDDLWELLEPAADTDDDSVLVKLETPPPAKRGHSELLAPAPRVLAPRSELRNSAPPSSPARGPPSPDADLSYIPVKVEPPRLLPTESIPPPQTDHPVPKRPAPAPPPRPTNYNGTTSTTTIGATGATEPSPSHGLPLGRVSVHALLSGAMRLSLSDPDDSFQAISSAIRKSFAGKPHDRSSARLDPVVLPQIKRETKTPKRSSVYVPLPSREPLAGFSSVRNSVRRTTLAKPSRMLEKLESETASGSSIKPKQNKTARTLSTIRKNLAPDKPLAIAAPRSPNDFLRRSRNVFMNLRPAPVSPTRQSRIRPPSPVRVPSPKRTVASPTRQQKSPAHSPVRSPARPATRSPTKSARSVTRSPTRSATRSPSLLERLRAPTTASAAKTSPVKERRPDPVFRNKFLTTSLDPNNPPPLNITSLKPQLLPPHSPRKHGLEESLRPAKARDVRPDPPHVDLKPAPVVRPERKTPLRSRATDSRRAHGNNVPLPLEARGKFVRSRKPAKLAEPQTPTTRYTADNLPDIPSDDDAKGGTYLQEWAATPELQRIMEEKKHTDPVAIFGEVPPLDMEAIFDSHSSRSRGAPTPSP